MSTHLDLDALAMLVAVAETGGFTAAGARLGRTQSAVSGRIQDLEATLGKQLLERSRRREARRRIPHASRLTVV